jgi:hypothetical protein
MSLSTCAAADARARVSTNERLSVDTCQRLPRAMPPCIVRSTEQQCCVDGPREANTKRVGGER